MSTQLADVSSKNLIKLIFVSGDANHNKYYDMQKSADGSNFTVVYGRVGCAKPQSETYPINLWEKKYNEKVKKGYVDHTGIRTQTKVTGTVKISDDKTVEELILELQKYANVNVANTYLHAADVTQAQIDMAQRAINNLTSSFSKYFKNKSWDYNNFNVELEKLYKIIPRKMKKVKDHLITDSSDKKEVEQLLSTEQDNLDSLISQYSANKVAEVEDAGDNVDLLAAMGLKVAAVSDSKVIKQIKDMMGDSAHKFSRVFEVTNEATQKKFDSVLQKAKDKKKELFYHGSRNQNWWFILQKGLLIRPSNAVHTGSMFGDGVYFANKARKSIGYTSLTGSYWASGSSNKAFLAVYEVHVGNQKHIHNHTHDCYSLNHDKLQRTGHDSVFAHGGADLRNDEFIVYTSEQSTIKYLIEIKN